MAIKNEMYDLYNNTIKSQLIEELDIQVMSAPKLEKIVINMGLGKAINDKGIIKDAQDELARITGQSVITTYAKVSNASFKIREGMAIGVKVTLRGQKMYDFLYKVINIALPRIRDFRGVSETAFDGRGNYTLGINEFIVFPEIELDKVSLMKGMDITFVTSSTTDNEGAYKLLEKFGMPFRNKNNRDLEKE